MRKFLMILTAGLFLTTPVYAQGAATMTPDVTVEVNGLVCDFCARALEKVFSKREDVNGIAVDLDTHEVTIDLKENATITDEEITSMIEDSGYKVVKINRAL